ncbi:MAG TPA: heparinase II/III family protein, partial [Gemmatimonadales bacterium]|nr:heparinase II/III family protein [Gemmatimonadales bacterium]
DAWLDALYGTDVRPADQYDAWLHDAGLPERASRRRVDLSWWSLLMLDTRELDTSATHTAPSIFLPSQGLGILRHRDRYASLECGSAGGGHGHPDRLHLTVHASGVHWLPDPGTGSYADRSLFWYRDPRAHNAPTVGGESPEEAKSLAFEAQGEWGWIRGSAGTVTRTVITGGDFVADLLETTGGTGTIELPCHLQGTFQVVTPGIWETASLGEAALAPERFVPAAAGPVVVESERDGKRVRLHFFGPGELFRATGPGLPGTNAPQPFLIRRAEGGAWLAMVLDHAQDPATAVEWASGGLNLTRPAGRVDVAITPTRASISHPGGKVALMGLRETRIVPPPLLGDRPAWEARALAPHAWKEPVLDGTLEGFDLGHPISLEDEHQYRRSEEPFDPERIAATAWLNWDQHGLYLAVAVRKPEIVLRDADAPALELDNEADDIHQDGLQVYLKWPEGESAGLVIVPDSSGGVRSRAVGGDPSISVDGGWTETEDGYSMTLAFRDPRLLSCRPGDTLGFDLLVNEMTSERIRRLGQLVWSGDGGWTYLRGDRGSAAGVVELG